MLVDLIPDNTEFNKNMVTSWNNVSSVLINEHIVGITKIEPYLGYKYRGDMYGLFTELEVPDEYIYPHILANGYSNGNAYDGKQLEIITLDVNVLRTYYKIFKKNNKIS